ncbi:MAG: chemotaxis response regulator protein-glutamate methylesterase [Spirochaetaceae bacterium]|nr:chemotaxis response regulator protein-glutamate methylesterase [Spirochaetaceae bacterium]
MKIKVLVIDDSAVVRQTMTDILSSDPEIEVVGTASDPIFAIRKIESDKPDVLTLDIEMPRMDGLTFLRRMNLTANPIPVVICSSKVEAGSDNAFKALEYGAAELILKPQIGTKQFLMESQIRICDAVKAAYCARNKINVRKTILREDSVKDALKFASSVAPKLDADVILEKGPAPLTLDTTEKVVVVGASTGGTEALKDFLEMLPVDAPGMVIVQHMPEHFTASFAKRLDGLCKVTVKEAEDGDTVVRGRVLIAPGNKHTLIKRSGARYYVEVKDGPLVSRHRPSVDVLFRSASRYVGKNAVGVIMTGMGDDGAKGMKEMHDAGAHTIAQDEASCIVFGMPCEAIKAGGVDEVVSLQNIAKAVMDFVSK